MFETQKSLSDGFDEKQQPATTAHDHQLGGKLSSADELTMSWINQSSQERSAPLVMLNNDHNDLSQVMENECKGGDDMNIDQLLELELSAGGGNGGGGTGGTTPNGKADRETPPLVDKFIDLDDIDVNPLDCYRTQQHQHGHKAGGGLMDEFGLQFSVSSSSSSGFSEPSNFSTCSSSTTTPNGGAAGSYMNGCGSTSMFGAEVDSSPSSYGASFVDHSPPVHQHHHHHHLHPPPPQQQHSNLQHHQHLMGGGSGHLHHGLAPPPLPPHIHHGHIHHGHHTNGQR